MTEAQGQEGAIPLVRIVDDDEGVLDALSTLLHFEGYRTACYSSAEALLETADLESPGFIVLDVRMPGMSGLEAQRALKERGSLLPVLFLTGHGDLEMAVQAMREGAFDFQEKPVDAEKFLPQAARAVEADRSRREGARPVLEEVDRVMALTESEDRILRAVARGLTSRMIAERLGISRRTVDHHRASGAAKLGVSVPARLAGLFERVDAWKAEHGL